MRICLFKEGNGGNEGGGSCEFWKRNLLPKRILRCLYLLFIFALLNGSAFAGFLRTDGNRIVDSNGAPVRLNGINWFGFETANFVLHGLWQRSMDSFLDQMHELGYDTLRVPYCNEMFNPGVMPNSINFYENPDLQGLTPIQILDKLIAKARARGMKIILDRHRPTSSAQSELWFTPEVSEARWISDWQMLAQRYLTNDTVIGADLHNEPRGAATWGSSNTNTDWRLAAERCGNAILSVNTNWLIIVEGIENYQNDFYWWGGNLKGAGAHPVRLNVANRLVYSPHDYGPGVFNQSWFNDANFPNNMPAVWSNHWAYLHLQNIAPILVGEFGGKSVDTISKEGIWQNALVDYIGTNGMYWTYWCWNPNSGDTGGVLNDDWATINAAKQAMLNRLISIEPPQPVAPPLIKENFSYGAADTNLAGLGFTDANWAGAWTGSANIFYFASNSLSYSAPGYFDENAAGSAGFGSGSAGDVAARVFATPLTGTIWISALVKFDSFGDDVLLWLRDNKSPVANNNFISLRGSKDLNNANANIAPHPCVRFNGANDTSVATAFAINQTHLFLARISIDAINTNDTLQFWIDPDLSNGDAGLGATIYSKGGQDAFGNGLSGVRVSFEGSGSQLSALRISNDPGGFYRVTGAGQTLVMSPKVNAGNLTFSFFAEVGKAFVTEYKTSLSAANWIPLQTNSGAGQWITFTNNLNNATERFYRIRIQ